MESMHSIMMVMRSLLLLLLKFCEFSIKIIEKTNHIIWMSNGLRQFAQRQSHRKRENYTFGINKYVLLIVWCARMRARALCMRSAHTKWPGTYTASSPYAEPKPVIP